MNKADDNLIIRRILAGENDQYRYLIIKYKNMGFNLAFKLLKNKEDAEESLSDGFLKAFQKLNSFDQNSSFSTWLYRIIYNNSISYLRRKKDTLDLLNNIYLDDSFNNYELLNESDEFEFDDKELKNSKLVEYLKVAISELKDLENIILTLYYFDSKSIDEIAKITSKSNANIKVILFRTRKTLFNKLQNFINNTEIK